MKKLLFIPLLLLSFTAHAQKGHIADDAMVYVHKGPNNTFRIITRIKSGTPVQILKRDSGSRYTQIKMPNGKIGWVESISVDRGDSITARLPKLDADLKNSRDTVEQQANRIEELEAESSGLKKQNTQLNNEVTALKSQIKELNFQLDSTDESNLMRWFTHGGLVAFGGVILGLILPHFPRRKKRRDDWF